MEKIRKIAPFFVLSIVAVLALFVPSHTGFADMLKVYNSADITWIMISTALVFLMTPALAFFYGGMVHRKNVLSTMMKSVVAAGIVSVLWVVVGYSLCFGKSLYGIIGDPRTHLFFKDVVTGAPWSLEPTIPLLLFSMFQLMFAIITPGLVVGAVAERVRFTSYTLFIVFFSLFVYAPLAHWTWHPDGFLAKMGAARRHCHRTVGAVAAGPPRALRTAVCRLAGPGQGHAAAPRRRPGTNLVGRARAVGASAA